MLQSIDHDQGRNDPNLGIKLETVTLNMLGEAKRVCRQGQHTLSAVPVRLTTSKPASTKSKAQVERQQ
jgi:hypothetical protein